MSTFTDYFQSLSQRTPSLLATEIADKDLSLQICSADLFKGKQGEMVNACRAGLLLFNDDLDSAHSIVQQPETQTNNFWHAIIHRREGDFSNARYWWNRTGTHSAFGEIYDIVIHRVPEFPFIDELRASHSWEPEALNDFCERAARTGEWDNELRQVQRLEMKILLEWCAARV